ncbi:MAG: Na/Pi cotransporter family protein [Planctomycetota bacterium]|nr:Na/Pi cotransporter family protein [Planctomycetota bacterium]
MNSILILQVLASVVGGLGLFLLGMKYLSDGLQTIAGSRLRSMLALVTANRLSAVVVGALVTGIIQSSSATTVMVVGFVNSAFLTLSQAIGVIMGANIGTTVTAWILVLPICKYGLPILGLAALGYRFGKNERFRDTCMTFMGLGMVFFGLSLMKQGFTPIKEMPDFIVWFSYFDASSGYLGVLKCALAGCLLTIVVQSSSATIGITIGLAFTGVIPFETAAALVLGENIGTTITTLLASIGTTINAKRAAYAHTLFNIIGVLWVTAIFAHYYKLILWLLPADPTAAKAIDGETIFPNVTAGIAVVHSVFNIANVILFLPFVKYMARFLERIAPDKPYKETPKITQLDIRHVETPSLAIEQSHREIVRMMDHTAKMESYLLNCVNGGNKRDKSVKKLFHREEILNNMQEEVTVFLSSVLSMKLTQDTARDARVQLRLADECESVGDYITNLLKYWLKLEKANVELAAKESRC